jgi:hypothetical protein
MFKDYALFNIRIRGAGPEYTVDVQSPLGGDASSTFTPPSGDPHYQELIANLQKLDTDEDMLIELGGILFRALFRSDIKEVYARSQGRLGAEQGLRLRFDLDPAQTEVAGLPWEFLYDPDQGPLALLDAPIVRYLPQQAPTPTLAAPLPLKVLVTGAKTPPEPEVERELAEVRDALAELADAGLVTIQVEEHLTQAILQRRLREGFHIWHFIGHGGWSRDGRSGTLLFEDGTGSSKSVSAAELNILLNRSGLRLVVLDACNTASLTTQPYRSVAPALVRAQIPAVIAMQFTAPQEATRPFAGEFYRALAEGFPLDACVTEGRKAVVGASGLRNPDWGIPVVYTRAPDGKLFELPASTPTSQQTSGQGGGINVNIGSGNSINQPVQINNVGSQNTTDSTIIQGANPSEDLKNALHAQIVEKKRRLYALQLTAARYGINTPPEIATQIEDLEGRKDYRGNITSPGEIAKLEQRLKDLGG